MKMKEIVHLIACSFFLSVTLTTTHLMAQCSNSTQPISTARLVEGPVNINLMNFDSVPVVSGVTSATDQVTQAVADLNTALAANGINFNYTINGSNSGTQVFYEVDTAASGVGSPEIISLPAGGWSTYGEITVNLNQTGSNGTHFFSTSGVTASNPSGWDTVFYKMAIHELLHTMGLDNTNVTSPPNIMNGINSVNDTNNSLGDAGNLSSMLTPCIFSQIKYALTAIHKPALETGGGEGVDPVQLLPFGKGSGGGGGGGYSCFYYSAYEWDEANQSLTIYMETACPY